MSIEGRCGWCGLPLVRRTYPSGLLETPAALRARRGCNRVCARRLRARRQATPLGTADGAGALVERGVETLWALPYATLVRIALGRGR